MMCIYSQCTLNGTKVYTGHIVGPKVPVLVPRLQTPLSHEKNSAPNFLGQHALRRQYSNLTMFKTICDTPAEKKQQINEQRCKFTAVQEVLRNKILISHWEAYMVRPKRGFAVKLLLFPIPVRSSIICGATCTNHPLQPDWRTVQSR